MPSQGKSRLKIISICFISNEKAYLATFTAEFDKYDKYQKTAEQILTSFSLTNEHYGQMVIYLTMCGIIPPPTVNEK